MENKNINQLLKALSYYGTSGIAGKNNNNTILNFFKNSKNAWVNNDEIAWCAAFVNSVLYECGLPQTAKLNARSFLDFGIETLEPVFGDIVVLWRDSKNGVLGHVGFFIKKVDNKIYILGGNQDNQVNIKAFDEKYLLSYRSVIIN
jgi:uncharacterized protein (TIGR02594 family)